MKRFLPACLFLCLFTAPVLAGEGLDDLFNRLDAEKDQQLTLDEFLKGDFSVSKGVNDNFQISQDSRQGNNADTATAEKNKRKLFERLDADRNGAVNRKEWMDSLSTGLVIFRY
jgi:Ca2+-binding EF-hand superfamily protein